VHRLVNDLSSATSACCGRASRGSAGPWRSGRNRPRALGVKIRLRRRAAAATGPVRVQHRIPPRGLAPVKSLYGPTAEMTWDQVGTES
jgi:hypothetical protein